MTTRLPDASAMILKIESRRFSVLDPGSFFEWHQVSGEVFVLRKVADRPVHESTQIGEAKTPMHAKQLVAAYAQGFAHAHGQA